ncbi:MAG: RibD family protein [Chthoniobacterales bacterium]
MKSRPYILANFAITLDGKISTRRHTPSLFTSQIDKQKLLQIRSLGDAVMVGRTTLEADTMSLGLPKKLREERKKQNRPPLPLRIIISKKGNLSPNLKIFNSPGGKILLFAEKKSPTTNYPNTKIHEIAPFALRSILSILRKEYAVQKLVCEGGPTLFRSLIEQDFIDELRLTITPSIFGGERAPGLLGLQKTFLPQIAHFKILSLDTQGDEAFLTLRRQRRREKKIAAHA